MYFFIYRPQISLQRITQVLPEHLEVSLREIFLRRVVTHASQFFFILFHHFLHKKVRNIWRMRKNGVSLRQNFTTMKIKTYNTKEEARAAFRRSIEMRAEYEAKVRQKWEEMKSSINPANAPATC